MVAYTQPKAFVVENVMELTGMRIIMEALKDMPCTYRRKVRNLLQPHLHEGQYLKSLAYPQNRERLFVIGVAKNPNGKPPLPEAETQLHHVPGEILEYEPDVAGITSELPNYIKKRMNGGYRDKPAIKGIGKDIIANTCVAHYARDQGTQMVDRGDGLITPYSVENTETCKAYPPIGNCRTPK